jgi:hypothetical protein
MCARARWTTYASSTAGQNRGKDTGAGKALTGEATVKYGPVAHADTSDYSLRKDGIQLFVAILRKTLRAIDPRTKKPFELDPAERWAIRCNLSVSETWLADHRRNGN